jgi:hypothetical protein
MGLRRSGGTSRSGGLSGRTMSLLIGCVFRCIILPLGSGNYPSGSIAIIKIEIVQVVLDVGVGTSFSANRISDVAVFAEDAGVWPYSSEGVCAPGLSSVELARTHAVASNGSLESVVLAGRRHDCAEDDGSNNYRRYKRWASFACDKTYCASLGPPSRLTAHYRPGRRIQTLHLHLHPKYPARPNHPASNRQEST